MRAARWGWWKIRRASRAKLGDRAPSTCCITSAWPGVGPRKTRLLALARRPGVQQARCCAPRPAGCGLQACHRELRADLRSGALPRPRSIGALRRRRWSQSRSAAPSHRGSWPGLPPRTLLAASQVSRWLGRPGGVARAPLAMAASEVRWPLAASAWPSPWRRHDRRDNPSCGDAAKRCPPMGNPAAGTLVTYLSSVVLVLGCCRPGQAGSPCMPRPSTGRPRPPLPRGCPSLLR
jgi:hypothetical protein